MSGWEGAVILVIAATEISMAKFPSRVTQSETNLAVQQQVHSTTSSPCSIQQYFPELGF